MMKTFATSVLALALLAGPGVRRIIARILGLPHK